MKIKSIKTKLLLLVLVGIFVSFSILGFYNTRSNYEAQYNLIKQQEINLVQENSKFIDAFFKSKIDIITATVDELKKETITVDNEKLYEKFTLSKKAGDFVDVYIGLNSDGSLLLANKDILNMEKNKYDARKRPWYIDSVEANKTIVTKPYLDKLTNKIVVSICAPLIQDGKLIGVVGSDIFIDTIVNTILNIKLDEMGLAYLIDQESIILIHKDKDILNKKDELFPQIKTKNDVDFGEGVTKNIEKLAAYSTIHTTNWKLVLQLNKHEIYKDIKSKVINEILLYMALLIIVLLFIFYALLKILAPIKIVENGFHYFFRYLKGEESHIKTINISTDDEFGTMAKVINAEMQTIATNMEKDQDLIDDVKKVVSDVKNGLLNVEVKKSTSNKSLNELKNILNDMIITINNNVNSDINPILSKLEDYAKLNFKEDIPNANGNIAKGLNNLCLIINQMLQANKSNGLTLEESSKLLLENVDVLNKSSNDTAVSLEETAAALEEITSTVINNTNRIQEMSNHSNELSLSIKEGQELANSTVTSMDEINEQTQAIAEAITVIDQIAFQTNILSLNAAVEAATAGEAGKGFAVVAQEVRNLASRSAEAAKEIKDLVENATLKTDNGKKIADKMIEGYKKLNNNIKKATEAINDISEASKEQKTSIEQINDVVTRLDRQSQSNASVANQAHQIAENTSKIAFTILEEVNKKVFREN
ncbi:methyl-accepting chemotaxis protein [Halarcobacter ebronensis]|uniref:methyl-accepting chemotaxis protein n=1 Tax=Halarcobacter ebronensis TaxID=1462615 RepID=UPI00155DC99E|nr:methyl-accepting chemotaxis protein [Halarcobacter ebronensis]QKF81309.1 Cache sensor-containing MCP-domain signal transduction protein [Halarcobacter ebronensis]